jgi:hypothetical protein
MDVEDATLRLDSLTREENLMAAARNLEITDRVDQHVVALVKTTQEFGDNVKKVETTTRVIDRNVQQTCAGV